MQNSTLVLEETGWRTLYIDEDLWGATHFTAIVKFNNLFDNDTKIIEFYDQSLSLNMTSSANLSIIRLQNGSLSVRFESENEIQQVTNDSALLTKTGHDAWYKINFVRYLSNSLSHSY